jgi:hypothetical protein
MTKIVVKTKPKFASGASYAQRKKHDTIDVDKLNDVSLSDTIEGSVSITFRLLSPEPPTRI